MDTRQHLLDLIKDDPFRLLETKVKTIEEHSPKDRVLISSFEEINNFVEQNNREPRPEASNILEFKLYSRLKAIRSDSSKVKLLKPYDFHNLLNENVREMTIEDVIADDSLGLLETDADADIYQLRHVRPSDRIKPSYLSRRKICKDFSEYAEMFEEIHNQLCDKTRRLTIYSPSHLVEGAFFVLNGVVLLLQSIEGKKENFNFKSGDRIRFDGRTRCIFDNGTESDMLYRSLDKALQLDGYSISNYESNNVNQLEETDDDVLNGYIYVLKSKRPDMQKISDLYKIGHTTTTVQDRIKNAKNEPTYLCDEVIVVRTYKCLNIKSYNIEQTIQSFFNSVRLSVKLYDRANNVFEPKEWFTVPLDIIDEAISLMLNSTISNYIYDARIKQIVKR